jgi:hypothetical protein
MKHLANLKTLGVAAFAAIILPSAAIAQIQTYYHAGVWDAFSGRNDKGGAVCGIGNTSPSDNRRMSIRFDIGGTDTIVTATKPDWAIPDGTQIRVVMQIGLNTPWTEQGNGHNHSVSWILDRSAMQPFDQQFASASSMTLTFPDGNEPPWAMSLAGSSAITATFARCINDLTSQVQAAKAAGAAAPPPTQGTTQPFNSSANGTQLPADTSAPATPSSGSQPDAATQAAGGTPSNGTTQPNGMAQPNGVLQSDGTTLPNATTQPAAPTQPDGTQPAH